MLVLFSADLLKTGYVAIRKIMIKFCLESSRASFNSARLSRSFVPNCTGSVGRSYLRESVIRAIFSQSLIKLTWVSHFKLNPCFLLEKCLIKVYSGRVWKLLSVWGNRHSFLGMKKCMNVPEDLGPLLGWFCSSKEIMNCFILTEWQNHFALCLCLFA